MNKIMHGKTKSLYHAITMALVALVSFVSISVGLINYFYQAREATALYNNRSSEYARYLHNELEWPLWNVDDELIRKIGNTFTSSTEIALLTILDDQQRVVYHHEKPANKLSRQVLTIQHNGHRIGSVELGLNWVPYEERIRQLLLASVITLLLLIGVLLATTRWILSRQLKKPVDALVSATRDMVEGRYEHIALPETYVEFAPILSGFKTMSDAVATREQRLRQSNERLAEEITERERSESRFRRVSDSNMIGIVFADLGGTIRESNEAFLSMVGYTREDLKAGKIRWTDLTPPEYQQVSQNAVQEVETLGVCRPFEKEYIREDGSRVPVLMGIALLDGSRDETVNYIIDMTERKRAERERSRLLFQEQKARAEAEKALRYREDFISIAAHELRTPLTPLRLQVQLVEMGLEKIKQGNFSNIEQLSHYTATTRKDLERFTHLVNSLLDTATVKSGKLLILKRAQCSLDQIVDSVLERFRAQLQAAGIEVFKDLETGVYGNWDCLRLEQVVINLITNASKYSRGTRVDVELKTQGERVRLIIKDNGVGIPEDKFTRIFKPFETGGPEKQTEGLGLGLFITREIIRAHGGEISVQSKGGRGTSFIIELPIGLARGISVAA